MRARMLALALAAALAGCVVPLDGAGCDVDDDCPGGQRCGFDNTCSVAASECDGARSCRARETDCGSAGKLVCRAVAGTACGEFVEEPCPEGESCVAPAGGDAFCDCTDRCSQLGRTICSRPDLVSSCAEVGRCWRYEPHDPCTPSERCVVALGAAACQQKWWIEDVAVVPLAGDLGAVPPLVGVAGARVTAIIKGIADDVEPPSEVRVTLQDEVSGVLVTVPMDVTHHGGGTTTYTRDVVPDVSGLDGTATLVVTVQPGEISTSRPVQLDTSPPAVVAKTGSCVVAAPARCLRDDLPAFDVADARLASVVGALLLCDPQADPGCVAGPSRPLDFAGDGYTLPLAALPFPFYERPATIEVTAVDGAGNGSTGRFPSTVTRLRWKWSPGAGAAELTSPAIDGGGTLHLLEASSTPRLHGIGPDGLHRWSTPLPAAGGGSSPPALGAFALWISRGGALYSLGLPFPTAGYQTGDFPTPCSGGTAPYSAAVVNPGPPGGTDRAWAGDSAPGKPRLSSFSRPGGGSWTCSATQNLADIAAHLALDGAGALFAATPSNPTTLRRYVPDAGGTLSEGWTSGATLVPGWKAPCGGVTCGGVAAPLSVDATDRALVPCADGKICRIDAAGVDAHLATLQRGGKPASSILPRDDGTLVVGAAIPPAPETGELVLLSRDPDDSPTLYEEADRLALPAPVTGVALGRGDGGDVVFATTSGGELHVVRVSAVATAPPSWTLTSLWTAPLAVGSPAAALGFPTVTASRVAPERLWTLYVASASGELFAVAVDEPLDPDSPWPKHHAGLGNTGRVWEPTP